MSLVRLLWQLGRDGAEVGHDVFVEDGFVGGWLLLLL